MPDIDVASLVKHTRTHTRARGTQVSRGSAVTRGRAPRADISVCVPIQFQIKTRIGAATVCQPQHAYVSKITLHISSWQWV